MAELMTTDVRALLDRTPFDASAVADLREVLGRDPSRYATLREAVGNIRDKNKEKLPADAALRLGVGEVLLGHFKTGLEYLAKAGDTGMAHFHRGLALENLQRWTEAADAFAAASKAGYEPKISDLHRAGASAGAASTTRRRPCSTSSRPPPARRPSTTTSAAACWPSTAS